MDHCAVLGCLSGFVFQKPFRTAVAFRGQTTWNLSGLSPKIISAVLKGLIGSGLVVRLPQSIVCIGCSALRTQNNTYFPKMKKNPEKYENMLENALPRRVLSDWNLKLEKGVTDGGSPPGDACCGVWYKQAAARCLRSPVSSLQPLEVVWLYHLQSLNQNTPGMHTLSYLAPYELVITLDSWTPTNYRQ